MPTIKLPALPEFIALMACLISLPALAIDAMLPAFPHMAAAFAVNAEHEIQHIIPALFLGLALGQLLFGPLSDSAGRKPLIYVGMVIFMLGTLLCIATQDFQLLLVGRFLQGFGAAAPRIISTALVRDCYAGRQMAQVMSFTMLVFILIPALAPSIGQGILWVSHWQGIFVAFLLQALLIAIWFGLRMPETLPAEKRTPLRAAPLWHSAKFVLTQREAVLYTVLSGLVFSPFMAYLSVVQNLLQVQYGLGESFPLYFAMLALVIGLASWLNAKWVIQYGMRHLCRLALIAASLLSLAFLGVAYVTDGHPAFWLLMAYLALLFLSVGLLFGNMSALAMEHLGEHAGMGASLTGSLSTLVGIGFGTLIIQNYTGSVVPLIVGFFLATALALGLMWSFDRPKEVAIAH